MPSFDRSDWDAIAEHFGSAFHGGTTVVDHEELRFDGSPDVETSLVLRRDGTSTSFMPLHGLEARWKRVTFEPDAITLEADGVTYTYRIPPPFRG